MTFETISNFENIFGETFSKVKKESKAYNDSLYECKYKLDLWRDEKARDKAFDMIYNFNLNGRSGSGSRTTPLFPFEKYMMNDGFKMVSFCELSAINPGVYIVSETQNGDVYINPKGIKYGRCYEKDDYFIYLGFWYRDK